MRPRPHKLPQLLIKTGQSKDWPQHRPLHELLFIAQGDHGIDAGGAAGRDVTGCCGYQEQ
jgi:hypothetical protein